jgi:hypothetical protein
MATATKSRVRRPSLTPFDKHYAGCKRLAARIERIWKDDPQAADGGSLQIVPMPMLTVPGDPDEATSYVAFDLCVDGCLTREGTPLYSLMMILDQQVKQLSRFAARIAADAEANPKAWEMPEGFDVYANDNWKAMQQTQDREHREQISSRNRTLGKKGGA